MITFSDLFAGCGGFHWALKDFGECVYACEIDDKARLTYAENFNVPIFDKDIKGVDLNNIPDHDILCAGFPCQPFSVAGKQEGFGHRDGNLFFYLLNIIEHKNPRFFILENVKNLKSHDKENTFKVIINNLENVGYFIKHKVLNSLDYGNLPQNRERIYIVGFRDIDNYMDFDFPSEIPLSNSIFGNIIDVSKKVDDKYYQTNNESPSVKKMLAQVVEKHCVYQYRRYYIRKNKKNICPTLTANMGTGGHNVPLIIDDYGVRKLTPSECFALQGFPVDKMKIPAKMSLSALYKQAGNAIPVPVVYRIAESIQNCMEP